MSSQYQIFDVIQEFHVQNGEETKQNSKTIEKNDLTSFDTEASLPPNLGILSPNAENSESSNQSEDDSQRTRRNRTKKINKDSKWTPQDEKNYWKFYIYYKLKYPFSKISWIKWKIDSIYKEMAKYINKEPRQCKSKDQNMKKKFLNQAKGLDVLEVALMRLQSYTQKDPETAQLIQEYNKISQKSSLHMALLNEKLNELKECQLRFKILSGMFERQNKMNE